jgi:hypothetical protein
VPDAIVLVDRVLQQAQDQLARDGVSTATGAMSLDELVATALGKRLAQMIANEDSAVVDSTAAFTRRSDSQPPSLAQRLPGRPRRA